MTATEVQAERDEIEAAIRGRTVPSLLAEIARSRPDAPAFATTDERWTWSQVHGRVLTIAAALRSLGLVPGDVLGVMASNRPEHILADLGASTAGATTTTLYATLAPEQIRHVVVDSGAKIVVVEGEDAWRRWLPVLGEPTELGVVITLGEIGDARPAGFTGQILTWEEFLELGAAVDDGSFSHDDPAVQERMRPGPEDIAVLIYTSGTTGTSKGVELSHRALLYEVEALARAAGLPDEVVSLSYLPLAHIAERVLSVYLPLRCGGETHFCATVKELPQRLAEVRPTILFGVPQVWDKLRTGIESRIAEQDGVRGKLGAWALRAAEQGAAPDATDTQKMLARLAHRAVLHRIPVALGLDRCAVRAVGAAPLPPGLERFFSGLGMELTGVYGLSETCGAAVMHRAGDPRRPGTVGAAMPGVELRLTGEGEVLVRGPLCASGYRNLPEADRDLFTMDGYLRTGDLGSLDDDGMLRITGRQKELIITAGGKNISPVAVESLLVEHPLIEQALVHGDGRPYLVALLMPDAEALAKWAEQRGLAGAVREDLLANPQLREEIRQVVALANSRLARVEHVREWDFAPTQWSEDEGELTPTRKIRRAVVVKHNREHLDALYPR
ncbi:AMP-dependent synthetase/ligase [Saccharopolyspora sp. NFXS83]|uniref:AMP-dependent synthetase/ligase n=1 Tax=Saccharopolyspora sp. NFXS83 TaxID=2993560 RepID=UPI00224B27D3|nr:AMP-dependent synthetase/ligase [Saccharopolyspora sp. NFXS83]MCX2729957.1 AMP-dependent synthetase/ligase [Saccharopolyspora sp. NFXS83]